MPIQVKWLVTDRVIYWDCYDNLSIVDIQEAEVRTYVMMQNSPARSIPLIFNLHAVKRFPSLREASKVRWILPTYWKNTGNIFVGIHHPLLDFALSTAYQLSMTKIKIVATLPQALQYLQAHDDTLPKLTVSTNQ